MSGWITVESKLPAYEEDVLFCVKGEGKVRYVRKGQRTRTDVHGNLWLDEKRNEYRENVYAWQPVPRAL